MEEKSVLQKIQEGAKGFTESVEEGITPFIPPEIRKLKPSMDFVLSGMPPNVIRSAGAKTQQFFDSDMKDIASGIGALGETASMVAPVGLLARFGAKAGMMPQMSRKAVEDFFALPVSSFKAPTDDGKGFITLHGSRHDFEQFDLGKIGKGEGKQVFGYGLYFTDVPGIANWYRNAGGHPRGKKGPIYETLVKSTKEDFLDLNKNIMEQPKMVERLKSLPYFDDFKDFYEQRRVAAQKMFKNKQLPTFEQSEGREILHELANFQILKNKSPKERSELLNIVGALRFVDENNRRADEVAASDLWNVGIDGLKYLPDSLRKGRTGKTTAGLPGFSAKEVPAKTEDRNFVVFDDTILNVLNKYGVDGKAIKLERKDKGGYEIPETVVPPVNKKELLGGNNPKRFFHGTTREFKDFDPNFKVSSVTGRDFEGSNLENRGSYYFTSNPQKASFYAKSGINPKTGEPFKSRDPSTGEFMMGAVKGSRVIPVYLKKGNYFDVDNADHIKTFKQSSFYKENKELLNDKFKFLGADIDDLIKSGEETVLEEITPQLKKLGFEGHTSYLGGEKNYAVYNTDLIVPGVEKKAKGGIAGLSDVARDMFKGPKGIGAYQPFMVG